MTMKFVPRVLAVLAIVPLLIGGYLGAYILLGSGWRDGEMPDESGNRVDVTIRWYDYEWQRILFAPASIGESIMTGHKVYLCLQGETPPALYDPGRK